jgi:hypothetical protein
MMDKYLSETCWADLEDQYILLFVVSSWSWFYYIAYIEDARSNTNQIQMYWELKEDALDRILWRTPLEEAMDLM